MTQVAHGQPISFQGRLRITDEELELPGDFTFHTESWRGMVIDTIWLLCPCGCEVKFRLPLSAIVLVPGPGREEKPAIEDTWGWDGNKEAPRLIPSILRKSGCRFHGHLGFNVPGQWTGARE